MTHCRLPDDRKNYVADPVLVVEVLSRSTMDCDRGKKLDFYKSLPSLKHIVLIYSDQTRIEFYIRAGDGWEPEILTSRDAVLKLDALQFELPVAQIYFDLDLP